MFSDQTLLEPVLSWALLIVVAIGCWNDWRNRRIPNWLTFTGVLCALCLRSFAGLDFLVMGIVTASATFFLMLPIFAAGAVGGGDVKFLVALASYMTPHQALMMLVLTAVVGAVISILAAIKNRSVVPLFMSTGLLAINLFTLGRLGSRNDLRRAGSSATAVPYGIAIGIGALMAWYL